MSEPKGPIGGVSEGVERKGASFDIGKYIPQHYREHYQRECDGAWELFGSVAGDWSPTYISQTLSSVAGELSEGNQRAYVSGITHLMSFIKFGLIDGKCADGHETEIAEGFRKVEESFNAVASQAGSHSTGEYVNLIVDMIRSALTDLVKTMEASKPQSPYLKNVKQLLESRGLRK